MVPEKKGHPWSAGVGNPLFADQHFLDTFNEPETETPMLPEKARWAARQAHWSTQGANNGPMEQTFQAPEQPERESSPRVNPYTDQFETTIDTTPDPELLQNADEKSLEKPEPAPKKSGEWVYPDDDGFDFSSLVKNLPGQVTPSRAPISSFLKD